MQSYPAETADALRCCCTELMILYSYYMEGLHLRSTSSWILQKAASEWRLGSIFRWAWHRWHRVSVHSVGFARRVHSRCGSFHAVAGGFLCVWWWAGRPALPLWGHMVALWPKTAAFIAPPARRVKQIDWQARSWMRAPLTNIMPHYVFMFRRPLACVLMIYILRKMLLLLLHLLFLLLLCSTNSQFISSPKKQTMKLKWKSKMWPESVRFLKKVFNERMCFFAHILNDSVF